jgi:hypothetical protein
MSIQDLSDAPAGPGGRRRRSRPVPRGHGEHHHGCRPGRITVVAYRAHEVERAFAGEHHQPQQQVGRLERAGTPAHRTQGERLGVQGIMRGSDNTEPRRRTPEPGCVAHYYRHRKAIDRLRRESRRDEAPAGSAVVRRRSCRSAGRCRRRSAPADLHLLPPGALAGGPDRADAPDGRRADRLRDRPRLPGPGGDGGSAHHPSEGQDGQADGFIAAEFRVADAHEQWVADDVVVFGVVEELSGLLRGSTPWPGWAVHRSRAISVLPRSGGYPAARRWPGWLTAQPASSGRQDARKTYKGGGLATPVII